MKGEGMLLLMMMMVMMMMMMMMKVTMKNHGNYRYPILDQTILAE